ncbi:MAG TPA: amidohydrolase family protein [Acidimicrobiales bacterium]|nr:amidohydrolase family protein [Acidimicrobiales bacterium]
MTRTVLHGGMVFDGSGAAASAADVLIEDGKIVDVAGQLDGDEGVDISGKWLLPGFFDCHTHVMFGPALMDVARRINTPFSTRFYDAVHNLDATLRQGITTIRDAAGADLGVKTAVERGRIKGPRMQISIAMLSQTGGHGDGWTLCGADLALGGEYPGMPKAVVDGPDAMRQKVRELLRAGADVIKVATSGGVLSPRDDPRHGHFRDDELEVLVAEATAAGKYVMAHAQANDGIKSAIRAGIRSIEHGIYLDDEAIQMMLDRGTFLVPTLSAPRGVFAAREAGIPVPDGIIKKCEMVIEIHTESIRRAIGAGVKVAMGTDSGVCPHGQNLRELGLMADCGMSPTDALVATTHTAAELLGVGDQLGTVETGKLADFVVIDGDPLELDKLPDRVSQVWKDGVRLVDTSP